MIVEIVSGRSDVKEVKDKNGVHRGFKQEAYATLPGHAFPAKCNIRVSSPLAAGRYKLDLPFQIGKFGDIEVNPFDEPKVSPVAAPAAQAKTA